MHQQAKKWKTKPNWTKGQKMLKFSDVFFTADMVFWLTRLPCAPSHYFTPWSCPNGIESLDLQFILRPLLQIFNRVLSFQSVINNLHQGGRLQIHMPELYPVPHWLWIAIILRVGEGLANDTKKSTIFLYRTNRQGFPAYTPRLSGLTLSHRKAKKMERLIFGFIYVSRSLNFCVAWGFPLIFTLILNQIDMLTEPCHLLWVYQQRWYEYNIFQSFVINYGNEW